MTKERSIFLKPWGVVGITLKGPLSFYTPINHIKNVLREECAETNGFKCW